MRITHFTITQDGQNVGSAAVMEQAVNAAKNRAARTGRPVSVIAHIDDGRVREVIYHPDGAIERLWSIAMELQNLHQKKRRNAR